MKILRGVNVRASNSGQQHKFVRYGEKLMDVRMRFKLKTLFLVVFLALLTTLIIHKIYCYCMPTSYLESAVTLCVSDGSDEITNRHVVNVLNASGIKAFSSGTSVVTTEVDASDFKKAVQLLERSAKVSLPTIVISRDASQKMWIRGDDSNKFEVSLNVEFDSIDQDRLAPDVREILVAVGRSKGEAKDSLRFTVLQDVSGIVRHYVNEKGKFEKAFEVTLKWFEATGEPNGVLLERFQILNNFQIVRHTATRRIVDTTTIEEEGN